MGLMNWLMKGIGFEDEEDQEAEAIKLERKIQKQKLKEAKRKEREASKLEKTNAKLGKYAEQSSGVGLSQTTSYAENPDQFNTSRVAQPAQDENYGGYGTNNYSSNSVGGYGSKNVLFFHPKSYDEVHKLIDYLKEGESIMLNLDSVSDQDAQRMLDFASGAIYAINGSIQRVSGNIFLLTPEGLNIIPN